MTLLRTTAAVVAAILVSTSSSAQIFTEHQNQPAGASISSVAFIDAQTGWVAGGGGVLAFTTDAGETWELKQPDPSIGYYGLVVKGPDSVWVQSGDRTIWRTFDGGDAWESSSLGQGEGSIQKMARNDTGVLLAVGAAPPPIRGPIYRSEDGSDWVEIDTDALRSFLLAVAFGDDTTAWAGGSQGFLMKTTDGGLTWTNQDAGLGAINALYFHNALEGYAVGDFGALVVTTDGGETWERMLTGTVKNLLAITFTAPDRGWIVGRHGAGLYTLDGGATWTDLGLDTRFRYGPISFGDPDHGWITGSGEQTSDGILYKTSQGTSIATQEEIPAGLESLTAFPNPFTESVKIQFGLEHPTLVQIDIYNALGQKVALLGSNSLSAGDHTVEWSPGRSPNGVYFYEVRAGSTVSRRSLVLAR